MKIPLQIFNQLQEWQKQFILMGGLGDEEKDSVLDQLGKKKVRFDRCPNCNHPTEPSANYCGMCSFCVNPEYHKELYGESDYHKHQILARTLREKEIEKI